MKEYQEKYIDNLKLVMKLSDLLWKDPPDVAQFLASQEASSCDTKNASRDRTAADWKMPLTRPAAGGESCRAEFFFAKRRENQAQIHRIARENTEILRQHLMPVLDDIVSASEDEIAALDEFAGKLLQWPKQLDLVLNYMLRCALVAYARKWKKRDMLICQLYHTGMALLYMQELADVAKQNRYNWKMGMMFGEAASYFRVYDEIEDPETRGYIHRAMANIALSYRWSDPVEARQKVEAIRRSFHVLTDPVYHAKTPSLPWDTYLYKSHQERTTEMTLLRSGEDDVQIIREVMESAEFVWKRQMENSRKNGIRPHIRWVLEYEMAQYHCGIITLPQLLEKMEELYMDQDWEDFSEQGIFGNTYLPAFYGSYLVKDRALLRGKKDIMSFMYSQMVKYVRKMPNNELNGRLVRYLLEGMRAFVEYPDGIQMKDFLIRLVVVRNPEIYVHLLMTGEVARMITRRAIDRIPESLAGVLDLPDAQAVCRQREELLQFACESGILHDVGRMMTGNLPALSGRSWLEEEKILYEFHTGAGERLLNSCESTKRYALTALGHHRWYNETGGYPEEYRRLDNPDRQMTDIVGIAAALTEEWERREKDGDGRPILRETVAWILDGAGTQFAPEYAALLPEMEEELAEYLKDAEQRCYRQAFGMMKGE